MGKKLLIDYQLKRTRADVFLNSDGTWIGRTSVRRMPILAGLWTLREGKIYAYENNRTDEGTGAIYNVFFLDNGQVRTEHFYANAKANEGPVTIIPAKIRTPSFQRRAEKNAQRPQPMIPSMPNSMVNSQAIAGSTPYCSFK